jgi:hypothetical protein
LDRKGDTHENFLADVRNIISPNGIIFLGNPPEHSSFLQSTRDIRIFYVAPLLVSELLASPTFVPNEIMDGGVFIGSGYFRMTKRIDYSLTTTTTTTTTTEAYIVSEG